MKFTTKPEPGTRVQLTATAARDLKLSPRHDDWRYWTVVACDCPCCAGWPYVAVDQPARENPAKLRHLNWRNLEPA